MQSWGQTNYSLHNTMQGNEIVSRHHHQFSFTLTVNPPELPRSRMTETDLSPSLSAAEKKKTETGLSPSLSAAEKKKTETDSFLPLSAAWLVLLSPALLSLSSSAWLVLSLCWGPLSHCCLSSLHHHCLSLLPLSLPDQLTLWVTEQSWDCHSTVAPSLFTWAPICRVLMQSTPQLTGLSASIFMLLIKTGLDRICWFRQVTKKTNIGV